jgi:bla regulator protein blaR1
MIPDNLAPLANHLWQSTIFAAAAMLLAFALRRNRAQIRFWLWLAASFKFLIPFSLLVNLGQLWELPKPMVAAAPVSTAVEQLGRPFSTAWVPLSGLAPVHSPGFPIMQTVLVAVWLSGCLMLLFRWMLQWVTIRRVVRDATPLILDAPVPVRSSAVMMEPGIFGIYRPVLLLPEGIMERLEPAQLRAILAHELCHVRRRDNLAAAIHMAVESLFWFHPLIWWIGARMVEERERACDEEVVRLGSEPEAYAEGILNVCKYCLESPLPCVAGVTGSNLKKRIEEIMTQQLSHQLSAARKVLLAAAGFAAVAGPVAIGILHTPQSRAQEPSPAKPLEFEVATVKPSSPDEKGTRIMIQPGGNLEVKNASLKQLITMAYDVREFQVSGGPGWINSDRFDIQAKSEHVEEPPDPRKMTDEQRTVMEKQFKERMRSLLSDRLQLVVRKETKEMPVYFLVVGKGGSKLQPAKDDGPQRGIRMQRGVMNGMSAQVEMLANVLANFVGRPVIDKTGIEGKYDWKLEWTPDQGPSKTGASEPGGSGDKEAAANPPDISGPSVFTALQEQLGLKLESQKAPATMIVIDRVEKPSAN